MGFVLGGAQFGRQYGIVNDRSPADQKDLALVFEFAANLGFSRIDTARGYGDSEAIIGQSCKAQWPVSSKFQPQMDWGESLSVYERQLKDSIERSSELLGETTLDIYLLHDVATCNDSQLRAIGKAFDLLRSHFSDMRFGVSLYNYEDYQKAKNLIGIEVVQRPICPLSADSFGINKDKLNEEGIEVHSRSVFLQGLLLAGADRVPSHLPSLRTAILKFEQFCRDNDFDPYSLCVSYAEQESISDHVVLGCRDASDLKSFEERSSYNLSSTVMPSLAEDKILDPRGWMK